MSNSQVIYSKLPIFVGFVIVLITVINLTRVVHEIKQSLNSFS